MKWKKIIRTYLNCFLVQITLYMLETIKASFG